MPENRIDETQEWLAKARLYVAESNLPAARDIVRRLLDRWPNHTPALQLLGEINAQENSSGSGLTAIFRIPQNELRDKLSDALDQLSATYDRIRRDIEEVVAQNAPRHRVDDKVRIADVAAIKQSLSEGSLDSAELRLNIALLTFPGDVELKALEVRLRNELRAKRVEGVPQAVVTPVKVRGTRLGEQQQEVYPTAQRAAAETVPENAPQAITDIGDLSTIPPSQRAEEISLHPFPNSGAQNFGNQGRVRDLWKTHWKKIVAVVAAIGLAGMLLAVVRNVRIQGRPIETKLVVNSSPRNARVFLNGVLKGTTPYETSWQIRKSETVSLDVRLELENYEPFEKAIVLQARQDQTLTPALKLTNLAAEVERLFKLAQSAVESGDLTSPPETNAMAYLNQMQELDPAGQTQPGSESSQLRSLIKSKYKLRLSQLSPTQSGTQIELSMLETFKTSLDPDDNEVNSRIAALNEVVEREKSKIQKAINGGVLLSSQTQNALRLISDLEMKFPRERTALKTKRDEIRSKVLEIARQKCLGETTECVNFIELASRDYPDDQELQSLRARSKLPESPRVVPASPPPATRAEVVDLKNKLEEAYNGKRYVTPQSDSVVHFANEVLRYIPDDPRATDLKQDSRVRAEKEIEQLTPGSQEKAATNSEAEARKALANFQQATEILGGLAYFWPGDTRIQRQLTDVKARQKSVQDFLSFKKTYPVIHSHTIGSCKGFLTITPYGMTYMPDMGNHGFDKEFKDIRDLRIKDGGENLEIKIEQRTLTFKYNKDINRNVTISGVEKDVQYIKQIRDQLETR
jgi:hypothetical protein